MVHAQIWLLALVGWVSSTPANALPHSTYHEAVASCGPLERLFYLTGVPSDGSATYPLAPAIVSRGAHTLSSATDYTAQWSYNTTDNRIYIGNSTTGSAEQVDGSPVLFGESDDPTRPYGDNGRLSLVADGECAIYLVMTGATSVYGWWSTATGNDSLPRTVAWYGDGVVANSAIRVGK